MNLSKQQLSIQQTIVCHNQLSTNGRFLQFLRICLFRLRSKIFCQKNKHTQRKVIVFCEQLYVMTNPWNVHKSLIFNAKNDLNLSQLIALRLFGVINFSQKTNQQVDLRYYHGSIFKFFRSFFGRSEDTKKVFLKLTDLYPPKGKMLRIVLCHTF